LLHVTLDARRDRSVVVFARSVAFIVISVLSACSSASSPVAPSASTQTPPAGSAGPPTVTLSATGFAPREITVPVGGHVTFVNADRVGHDINSGIDHTSRDCPEVDVVGFLVGGQSRDTSVFGEAKTCRFHDHDNVGNPAYQGRIVAQ
jgi:plastocyanin